MKSMYVGSGDTNALLAGLNTLSHQKLLQRFVSNEKPYYNAKNSPIDALRTGAILESRYLLTLDNSYYEQYKSICTELNVLKSSIDFAKLDSGKIVDFDELKTANFDDFLKIKEGGIEYVKKKYKNNYNQVQFQLLCSGLESANLVFLVVYTYEDEINQEREIKANEVTAFRIERDNKVIDKIRERALIFQQIKDFYS
jgi:hypothetical protein